MQVGGGQLTGVLLERRYRIDTPIARGGMSTVFRGVDTRLDRPVAIKVMDPRFAADPQFLARFEFEARAVAKLKHPGLVAVYDQGVDPTAAGEPVAFLVMELVEGGTLRELLNERGPMPPHAVRGVAEPVLDALAVAHAAGLVHRDVKPENVLISDSGEVKIADFGLVRAVAASTTTSSSVILGTAAYLSPEQVMTGAADARSDVYAMGVLIFEMLTGQTPFTGDTSLSIAYQRIDHDVPSPSRCIAGVPEQFDHLVATATARDPAHRFPDAAAMATALRTAAARLRLPTSRVPAPRQSAEHRSARYLRPVAATVAGTPTAALAGARTVTAGAGGAPVAVAARPPRHTRVVTAPTDRTGLPVRPFPPIGPPPNLRGGPPTPRRGRRRVAFWLAALLVVAGLAGGTGWWYSAGRMSAVPETAGMAPAAATAALESAGFTGRTQQQHSDTVPAQTVIGTEPDAGRQVPRGSTIAVLVSLGRPMVPQISAGTPIAVAQRQIIDAGLQPTDGGEAFSTQAPIGTVARVDPAPGTALTVGSAVKVVRSRGAPPVELPDLSGKSVAEAAAALEKLGLVVAGSREEFDAEVDGGDVIGTDPASGSEVHAGDSVTLIISNAVRVPLLLGRTVNSARDTLSDAGLRAEVRRNSGGSSLVIGQTPGGAGNRVEPGSTVTLTAWP